MKFKLAFALHNHQPVGNFPHIFEQAHKKCYVPFLELIKKYPGIRFSLHQSGILWDWQEKNHPEFFDLVRELVDGGRMELLTGGFYEPILSSIPERDKIGQIDMLTGYLKRHFGVDPKGMWLAERVWEPHLPKAIHECGVRYLAIDDTHFKYAGLRDDQFYGTYVTEEEGKSVTLLPILERLRYLIPFGTPEEVIEFLAKAAQEHPGGLAIYADDGEKFGIWPNTYRHVYQDGWLKRFFALLEESSDWLEVIGLGEAVRRTRPLDRVYLPTASYSEMLHWALPPDSFVAYEEFEDKLKEFDLYETYGRFVRGGHWRGFLAKYPESNLMHKKMLAVSELFDTASKLPDIDSSRLDKARDLLFAGQCNCPFWHGVFGGLYLPHLRQTIYARLIEAETILRRLTQRVVYIAEEDRNRDGYDDIVLGGEYLSMVLAPAHGGRIVELDLLENNVNIADCLTRRREGYHKRLLKAQAESDDSKTESIHDMVVTKEKGLEKLLVDDWYLRRPLADHFLGEGTTIADFLAGQYSELGDFILEPFETKCSDEKNSFRVDMTRDGHFWHGDFHCPLRLTKKVTFPKKGNTVNIEYCISQSGLEILPITFGVEFDFNLLAPDADDRYVLIDGERPKKSELAATDETSRVSSVSLIDEWQKIGLHIETTIPGRLWRMPINTVSLSEGGFEKVFQGTCAVFVIEKSLRLDEKFEISFELTAGPLRKLPAKKRDDKLSAHKT